MLVGGSSLRFPLPADDSAIVNSSPSWRASSVPRSAGQFRIPQPHRTIPAARYHSAIRQHRDRAHLPVVTAQLGPEIGRPARDPTTRTAPSPPPDTPRPSDSTASAITGALCHLTHCRCAYRSQCQARWAGPDPIATTSGHRAGKQHHPETQHARRAAAQPRSQMDRGLHRCPGHQQGTSPHPRPLPSPLPETTRPSGNTASVSTAP